MTTYAETLKDPRLARAVGTNLVRCLYVLPGGRVAHLRAPPRSREATREIRGWCGEHGGSELQRTLQAPAADTTVCERCLGAFRCAPIPYAGPVEWWARLRTDGYLAHAFPAPIGAERREALCGLVMEAPAVWTSRTRWTPQRTPGQSWTHCRRCLALSIGAAAADAARVGVAHG
jgi:hypothetical protein